MLLLFILIIKIYTYIQYLILYCYLEYYFSWRRHIYYVMRLKTRILERAFFFELERQKRYYKFLLKYKISRKLLFFELYVFMVLMYHTINAYYHIEYYFMRYIGDHCIHLYKRILCFIFIDPKSRGHIFLYRKKKEKRKFKFSINNKTYKVKTNYNKSFKIKKYRKGFLYDNEDVTKKYGVNGFRPKFRTDFVKKKLTFQYLRKYILYIDCLFYKTVAGEYDTFNQGQNEHFKINKPMYRKYYREFLYILDTFLLGTNLFAISKRDKLREDTFIYKLRDKRLIDKYQSLTDYIFVTKVQEPFYKFLKKIKLHIKFYFYLIFFLPKLFLIALFKTKIKYDSRYQNNKLIVEIVKVENFKQGLKNHLLYNCKDQWSYLKARYELFKDLDLTIQRYYYYRDVYLSGGAFWCARLDNTFFQIELIKMQIKIFFEVFKSVPGIFILESYYWIAFLLYHFALDIDLAYLRYIKLLFYVFFPFFFRYVYFTLDRYPNNGDPKDYLFDNLVPIYQSPFQEVIPEADNIEDIIDCRFYSDDTGAFFYDDHEFDEIYDLFFDNEINKRPIRSLSTDICHNDFSEGERIIHASEFCFLFREFVDFREYEFGKYYMNNTPAFKKNINEAFLEEMEGLFKTHAGTHLKAGEFYFGIIFDRNIEVVFTHSSGYKYSRRFDTKRVYSPVLDLVTPYRYFIPLSMFDKRVDLGLYTRDPNLKKVEEDIHDNDFKYFLHFRRAMYPTEKRIKLTPRKKVRKFFRLFGFDILKLEEDLSDEVEYGENIYTPRFNIDFAYFNEYEGDIEVVDFEDATEHYLYAKTCIDLYENFQWTEAFYGSQIIIASEDPLKDPHKLFKYIYHARAVRDDDDTLHFAPKYVFAIYPLDNHHLLGLRETFGINFEKKFSVFFKHYNLFLRKKYVYVRFYKLKHPTTLFTVALKRNTPYARLIKRRDNSTNTASPVLEMIVHVNFFNTYILKRLRLKHIGRRKFYYDRNRMFPTIAIMDLREYDNSTRRCLKAYPDPLKKIFRNIKDIKTVSTHHQCDINYYPKLYNEFKDAFFYHKIGFILINLSIIFLYILNLLFVTLNDYTEIDLIGYFLKITLNFVFNESIIDYDLIYDIYTNETFLSYFVNDILKNIYNLILDYLYNIAISLVYEHSLNEIWLSCYWFYLITFYDYYEGFRVHELKVYYTYYYDPFSQDIIFLDNNKNTLL